MDRKKPEQPPSAEVRALFPIPRVRSVAPLTDAEITKLRQLLIDFEAVATGCPIAKRELSKR